MIGVLAKLAGQDSSRAMAHWAKLRTHKLASTLPPQARAHAALQYLEPGLGSCG
jgi:hypothetical protein